MNRDLQGHYITISTVGEKAQAFVPASLPPAPPIEWSSELREKFDQALLALGQLDSVSVWVHPMFMATRLLYTGASDSYGI
nr:hypothetical protein [uncultured Desulfobulbus sp.]